MNLMKKMNTCMFTWFVIVSFAFQSSVDVSVDKLLKTNRTKEATETMVQQVIKMYEKKYSKVSFMTWGSIEKSIDYSSYYKKVKQIYSSSFTESEIKELIKLYNAKNMDKYAAKTKRVEQQLYNAGKEFGKEISKLITSKIQIARICNPCHVLSDVITYDEC